MLTFALRSLLARRRRAALTALAVLLGVAMVSGTFVFNDTINAADGLTPGIDGLTVLKRIRVKKSDLSSGLRAKSSLKPETSSLGSDPTSPASVQARFVS